MLDALDGPGVRAWSRTALDLLAEHRGEIDALNVFPVPDSDTGANMLATLRAGAEALDAADGGTGDPAGPLLAAFAAGAARGAVGNSGFILSQILRGLAQAARQDERCDARTVAAGLAAGALLGHGAVVGPVEGTILTVARAAAEATGVVGAATDLAAVVTAAYAAAARALAGTTAQLAPLHAAGVVDAGGRGLVVVLGALVQVVTGEPVRFDAVTHPAEPQCTREPSAFGFEVQYLLDAPDDRVQALREVLDRLGDSVVVVPVDGGTVAWNVHVHVDDVGAAIEAGVDAGRPHRISVTELSARTAAGPTSVAILAVAPGAGLTHLFEREGVHVVESAQSMESAGAANLPSVDDVSEAIDAAGSRDIVLLPNASRVTGVAEEAARRARERGVHVAVVPTRSPVQGLAAIAVHDPARRFDDDVVAMAEAAGATRWAEITTARTEALTAVGICQPGDVLGLIDGEVVEIGAELTQVTLSVVDRLLGVGGELMTVLVGADAPAEVGELVEKHVRARSPLLDVAVYQGGQPDNPVVIGVE